MILNKKSGFEEKYFKGKESNYCNCLTYKTGNLSYLFEYKILPVLKTQSLKNDKVLDLGCAFGILLEKLDKVGFKTYGVDISNFAISEAKKRTKADLKIGNLNHGLLYQENSFGAVCAIDILEHLDSPFKFAKETHRILKKGGLFFIHTPNINSVFEKIFKKNWFGYQDKTHLYLFNRKNLQFLLEQAGFKILVNETIFYPAPVFLRPFFVKTEIGGTVWIVCQKV